jgi:hypothetical protein
VVKHDGWSLAGVVYVCARPKRRSDDLASVLTGLFSFLLEEKLTGPRNQHHRSPDGYTIRLLASARPLPAAGRRFKPDGGMPTALCPSLITVGHHRLRDIVDSPCIVAKQMQFYSCGSTCIMSRPVALGC